MENLSDYVPVGWPDSQEYMDHPDFDQTAILINEGKLLHILGPSSYLIPRYIIDEIDNETRVDGDIRDIR